MSIFTSKLSEQNDYPEVVKIPEVCHRVIIVCLKVVMVAAGSS